MIATDWLNYTNEQQNNVRKPTKTPLVKDKVELPRQGIKISDKKN